MRRLAAILFLASLSLAHGATRYVSLSGSHTSPYTNWAMASTNLEAAMTGYSAGDSILLTNGYWPAPTGRTSVANLTIESVNGSAVTTIDGGGNPRGGGGAGFLDLYSASSSNALRGVTVTRFSSQGSLLASYATLDIYITDCAFTGNVDIGVGLGNVIQCNASVGIFQMDRCVVAKNFSSGSYGGAIGFSIGSAPGAWTISNTLIANNTSTASALDGSVCGLFVYGPTNVLINSCTIANNVSANGYGGIQVYSSGRVRLENTIVWGNTGPDGSNYSALVDGIYNDAGPALSGEGNISDDPDFTSGTDYSLQSGSPCVDVGTNRAWMVGVDDLAGNDRIFNTIVDIGAYEHQGGGAAANPDDNYKAALQWWRMIQ